MMEIFKKMEAFKEIVGASKYDTSMKEAALVDLLGYLESIESLDGIPFDANFVDCLLLFLSDWYSTQAIKQALVCLKILSFLDRYQSVIRVKGGITKIIHILHQEHDSEEIQFEGCAVLSNLSNDDANKRSLAGTIPIFIDVMSLQTNNLPAQRDCINALRNLSKDFPMNEEIVIPALIRCMQTNLGEVSLQVAACEMLQNLLVKENAKAILMSLNAIDTLARVLQVHQNEEKIKKIIGSIIPMLLGPMYSEFSELAHLSMSNIIHALLTHIFDSKYDAQLSNLMLKQMRFAIQKIECPFPENIESKATMELIPTIECKETFQYDLYDEYKLDVSSSESAPLTVPPSFLGNIILALVKVKEEKKLEMFDSTIVQEIDLLQKMKKILEEGQWDSSELMKILNEVLLQMQNLINLDSIQDLVRDVDANVQQLASSIEDSRREMIEHEKKEEMYEVFEKNVEVIEKHTKLLATLKKKIDMGDKNSNFTENTINTIEKSNEKSSLEIQVLRAQNEKLKERCEADVKLLNVAADKDAVALGQQAFGLMEDLQDYQAAYKQLEEEEEKLKIEQQRIAKEKLEIANKAKDIMEKQQEVKRKLQCKEEAAEDIQSLLSDAIERSNVGINATKITDEFVATGNQAIIAMLITRKNLLQETHSGTMDQYVQEFRKLYKECGILIYKRQKLLQNVQEDIQKLTKKWRKLTMVQNPKSKKCHDKILEAQVQEQRLHDDIKKLESIFQNESLRVGVISIEKEEEIKKELVAMIQQLEDGEYSPPLLENNNSKTTS